VEGIKWIRLAADQRSPEGQNYLGVCYAVGRGVRQDDAEAFRWYRRAAEQGLSSAQQNLGFCYSYGRGVSPDHDEAFKWFAKAAEQGDLESQVQLGIAYTGGLGVPKDQARALVWLRKAAAQGSTRAISFLNDSNSLIATTSGAQGAAQVEYHIRVGTNSVIEHIRPSPGINVKSAIDEAENGNRDAQFELGTAYVHGHGLARDYVEGAKWLRRAIERGHTEACLQLSFLYRDGLGVTKDEGEALKWRREAAERGSIQAQLIIIMNLSDATASEDLIEACKWSIIAGKNGNKPALARLGALMTKLTPEQLEEGKRRAAAFVPRTNALPSQAAPARP
jgi:TPR repeat protein